MSCPENVSTTSDEDHLPCRQPFIELLQIGRNPAARMAFFGAVGSHTVVPLASPISLGVFQVIRLLTLWFAIWFLPGIPIFALKFIKALQQIRVAIIYVLSDPWTQFPLE
jgi:hypothetical protein